MQFEQNLNKVPLKVLDISCGHGEYLSWLRQRWPQNYFVGVDMDLRTIQTAKEKNNGIEFVCCPAENMPFENFTFDRVVCQMSFHHYKHPKAVLREVLRVLKPGGKFFVQDFFPKYKWSQVINNLCGCRQGYHFEKFYLKTELVSLAVEEGFRFVECEKLSRGTGQHEMCFVKS